MSRATSAIGRDVSITIFTASSLNSCVNFLRRSGILHPPFRAGLYWIRCPESPRQATEVARVLGVSRNTVKAALASDGPPAYRRRPAGSVVEGFEPRIRGLLQAYPSMPATVIGERVGWPYSIRTLSGRVAELRPAFLPPDPASRTSYAAGEVAQCDFWFPDIELPVGFGQIRTAKLLPVLTM